MPELWKQNKPSWHSVQSPHVDMWWSESVLCVSLPDSPVLTSRVAVTVHVLDINEFPPELSSPYETFVCENAKMGQVTFAFYTCWCVQRADGRGSGCCLSSRGADMASRWLLNTTGKVLNWIWEVLIHVNAGKEPLFTPEQETADSLEWGDKNPVMFSCFVKLHITDANTNH